MYDDNEKLKRKIEQINRRHRREMMSFWILIGLFLSGMIYIMFRM